MAFLYGTICNERSFYMEKNSDISEKNNNPEVLNVNYRRKISSSTLLKKYLFLIQCLKLEKKTQNAPVLITCCLVKNY